MYDFESQIVDIPDYPEPGVIFKDITPLFGNPEALKATDHVCASVNIGSTKTGINLDAVGLMGRIVRRCAEITADDNCFAAAKLVVFCNAPEDNPFMAGA
ncbi:MAG: DUF711 family protein, partial [Collinsella sp.]|nr:DUF711 family protein [Collinsella sp.]